MKTTRKLIKKCVNKELSHLGTYHSSIPLDDIFSIVKKYAGQIVQEDGTPWSGLLCGENGDTYFDIEGMKNCHLRLTWHKMQSGNYEVIAYIA